jgi:hypothetical protein
MPTALPWRDWPHAPALGAFLARHRDDPVLGELERAYVAARAQHQRRATADAADPANALSYGVVHADGTYIEVHPLVGVGVGVWRATGERTADLTIVFQDVDPSPAGLAAGALTVRVAVAVDATGSAITAPFTTEGRAPDGTVLFANAFTAMATRLAVEPMAPQGTPAATPAA